MEDKFIIRRATKEDCASLHKLIQELATYEKVPHIKMNVETLEKDGFGSNPIFTAFVATTKENDHEPIVGYAIYYFSFSTYQGKYIHLEDVYVQENYRRKGIGLSFFRCVAQEAQKENCMRLDFTVLDWNTSSIDFYKSQGAINLTEQEGRQCFRFTREGINKLASN